jgi:hypothetical protein
MYIQDQERRESFDHEKRKEVVFILNGNLRSKSHVTTFVFYADKKLITRKKETSSIFIND